LKPGGSFVLAALRQCSGYRVGDQWFPAANISPLDLAAALPACGADDATVEIAECDLPTHADQGYRGILLAAGRMTGE
jgi:hypothetical protein